MLLEAMTTKILPKDYEPTQLPAREQHQVENKKENKKKTRFAGQQKYTQRAKHVALRGIIKRILLVKLKSNKNQSWNKDKKPPEAKSDEITCLLNEIYAKEEVK